ncbi:trichohyalin [Hoplias malabaricus]|uniref:trichohyalin n=1 Tax=Hoplias malabaricus TaxID=27720 RepID=UPI00346198D5
MDRMWDRERGGKRGGGKDQRVRERFTTEWYESERKREVARHPHGRIASVLDVSQHIEREREKGDTFPRTRRRSNERERRPRLPIDQGKEKTMERGEGRPRELDKSESERERARKRDRDLQRYKENERAIIRDGKWDGGGRLEKEESDRVRNRGLELVKKERRREKDAEVNDQEIMRVRERDRPGYRDRDGWLYSMQRDRVRERDRGNLSDREDRDERSTAWRREKQRHTKSEGDSDGENERDPRRKDDIEILRYEQNKSNKDTEKERTKERRRDRERNRELEWQRERDTGKEREIDTSGYRGKDRNKELMPERYMERNRQRAWEREQKGPDRQRDGLRDTQDRRKEKEPRDRWRVERERETRIRPYPADRETDTYQEKREQERRRSWEEVETGRCSHTQREAQRKVHMGTQSSGEWMSSRDVRHEQRRTEMDKERKSSLESDKEKKKKKRSEEGQDVPLGQIEGEARERFEKEEMETEEYREKEKPESKQRPQRKMWLEPRSERARTESLAEEFRERELARERYVQRYKEKRTASEEDEIFSGLKKETEPVSPEDRYRQLEKAGEFMRDAGRENIDESWKGNGDTVLALSSKRGWDTAWQMETENMEDNAERSDREDESGSGRNGVSEGEEGSEREWEGEGRERVTSGEDGFVTVSSGGDEDEAEEDKFEDCKEFWDGEVREDLSRQSSTQIHQSEGEIKSKMTEGRSDRTVTLFCVVGQTLPRSGSNQNPEDPEEQEDGSTQDLGGGDIAPFKEAETSEESVKLIHGISEAETSLSHDLTLSEEEITSNCNTEGENCEMSKEVTSPQDLEFTGSVCAEQETESHSPEIPETSTNSDNHENAQKKMTGGENREKEETCVTEEERKRHSAAPHVKWAKNVLKEILGSSEDGTLNMPDSFVQTEQQSDEVLSEAEHQGESLASPLYGIVQKPRKRSSERKHTGTDMLQEKEDARNLDTPGHTILIQVEKESDTEEELEEQEREMLEGDTDEEYDYDRLLVSPDRLTHSSDGETEKESGSKKDKKPKKKKTVWDVLSSSSFRDLGNEARSRRKGFRKSVEKHSEDEDVGGIARDRRTRVFRTGDDEYDDLRHSFNESELRNFKVRISRTRMRNSKFYNAQLYQQYSEVVQNREILHQSNSDTNSVFGEIGTVPVSSSLAASPPLARRPLPPLPGITPPPSISRNNSVGLTIPHLTPPRPPSPRLSTSFASSPMLWQELPGVRNDPELKNLSVDERRLQEVRFEVVTSEASYCSSLDIVVEHFVKSKQMNALLTTQEKNWLFSRLGDVRAVSHSFFSQLEERVESDIMHFTVCDIIIKHCPRFQAVYVPYLTNQSYQDKTYQRLMNENAGFRNIVEKLEHSPKCQRLPLRSFLILPFQRITRLKLLVQNIVKRTAPKTTDEAQATKAMKLLEKMIQDSNESISQMRSIESLVSLNARVDFECKTLPLISQSRRLVREGLVTELRDFSLKENERSAYIHLFNDYLLVSLPKEGGKFTVIDHAPVSELRAENCRVKLHSLQKNLFRLHIGQKALLLRTETQADKLRWISALSRPHPEIDLSAAQDIPQMQCVRAFVAQQPDELSLEKADVLLVHQQSSDGWVEGTRLSDRQRGWVPESHLETIHSGKARQCNLLDTMKITAATATV